MTIGYAMGVFGFLLSLLGFAIALRDCCWGMYMVVAGIAACMIGSGLHSRTLDGKKLEKVHQQSKVQ